MRQSPAMDRPLLASTLENLGSETRDSARPELVQVHELVSGYLLPRLSRPDRQSVVAFIGGTGSGKSTLFNSLAGREISRVSVLRPTTTAPIAWCAEDLQDMEGFGTVVRDRSPLLREAVLVDTPDLDSRDASHHEQTKRILRRADVAVVVTTPQRYADAIPTDVVAELTVRKLPVIVTLNRMTADRRAVITDLVTRWRRAGLAGISSTRDIVVISEHPLTSKFLPLPAVLGLRNRVQAVTNRAHRAATFASTLGAVIAMAEASGALDDVVADLEAAIAG